ncbi:hypothetical protein, partial [Bradyrhizobium sp.]|uniref:hypothetical protein n=1 Tax=Bradyrhizobium sp. TaxID=376 RepID=UPI003C760DD4
NPPLHARWRVKGNPLYVLKQGTLRYDMHRHSKSISLGPSVGHAEVIGGPGSFILLTHEQRLLRSWYRVLIERPTGAAWAVIR